MADDPSKDARTNRRYWDRFADEYQDRHASQLNRRELCWGVWAIPESELNVLGDISHDIKNMLTPIQSGMMCMRPVLEQVEDRRSARADVLGARLSAWELGGIEKQHLMAGSSQRDRRGTASGARTDNDGFAALVHRRDQVGSAVRSDVHSRPPRAARMHTPASIPSASRIPQRSAIQPVTAPPIGVEPAKSSVYRLRTRPR